MIEEATQPNLDMESLLALSEEEISQLPAELAGQVQDLIQARKDEAEKAEQERQGKVAGLGQRIMGLYTERKGQRTTLEQRWLKEVRQYNGVYEAPILVALQNRKYGSRAYVPLTRRVVNIVEARLIDLLFPTEDRNWAVDPSPVPMLVQAEALASQLPPGQMVPMGPNGEPATANAIMLGIREVREEARSRADNMQREVDDQLRQANYPSVSRRVLHEAMVIGTGVIKGPMVLNRTKKVWLNDASGSRVEKREDLSPTAVQVSTWDFFPDMSARTIKDSESDIERHYFTKVQLARLATQPGFEFGAAAIARALTVPAATMDRDANRDSMREMSGTQGVLDPRYMVLEYHGPVEPVELEACGCALPKDPLAMYEGVIWVMEDGSVLKAIINPMDTEERPYSVFCWERDPASIFGFSLCHEVSDMAESANSSFRAALDNLGLSVGPQIVVNSKVIRPHNGNWSIEPNKIWEMIKADADARAAFAFFQIDSRLADLLGVFDRSKQMIDDLAGPVMAMQGQEAPSYLDTARGASIAFNAANIWMRRAVRNWDDDISAELPSRFIDWNMQYNPKQEIKGDLMATARGTTALLEGEGQAQKMGIFLNAAKEVPMPFKRRINQLKAMARSMRLDSVDLLPDEAEVKQLAEKIDNAPPPLQPEIERIKLRQAEIADNQAQRDHEMQIKTMEFNLRAAEIAAQHDMTIKEAEQKFGLEQFKVTAKMQTDREDRAAKAQALNAELAVKMQKGSGI